MSGQGHSRRFDPEPATSGLRLRTDIHGKGRHVSEVPQADIARAE
jgi:hypothetical protein